MLGIVLAVRFILELCLLAAFGWAGAKVAPSGAQLTGGAGVVICVAAAWGLFLSPRRRIEIGPGARLMAEILLFAMASAALFIGGHSLLAILLMATALINRIALDCLDGARAK